MRPRWNRLLWGVTFTGANEEPPMLLGSTWSAHSDRRVPYPGEPTRALLFTTRDEAWRWCAQQMAEWQRRPKGDILREWRVRPVRVREVVEVVA